MCFGPVEMDEIEELEADETPAVALSGRL